MVDIRAVSAAREERPFKALEKKKKRDLTKMNSPHISGRGPTVSCDEL